MSTEAKPQVSETAAQAQDARTYGMYVACGSNAAETAHMMCTTAGTVRAALRRHAARVSA